MTFTRKAAAELRARFQVGLEKAAREAKGIEKTRLDEAVKHVERAFLGHDPLILRTTAARAPGRGRRRR